MPEETKTQKILAAYESKGKISDAELQKHNDDDTMWVVVHDKVFDFTEFW